MTSKPSQAQVHVTQSLLARAHSPDTAARILSDKIQHRPLLLKPSDPAALDARQSRRRAARQKQQAARRRSQKQKPAPLSARQRRALKLYDVPRAGQRYAAFEPLHNLWLGYVREVLGRDLYFGHCGNSGNGGNSVGGDVNPNAAAKLSSADFHGAEVEVVRSRCVGRVGIRGIVIKDGMFVFEIVTRKNKLKVVPKEGTVFRVEVPAPEPETTGTAEGKGGDGDGTETKSGDNASKERPKMMFEIRGDMFMHRSADRATKKLKYHFLENAFNREPLHWAVTWFEIRQNKSLSALLALSEPTKPRFPNYARYSDRKGRSSFSRGV